MASHVVYIEKLHSLNDYSPEWPVVAAGMVVLRLVDAWLREGAEVIRRDVAGLEAVRQTVGRLPNSDQIRPLLSEMVDVIEQSEVAIVQWVSPYLWRYGDTLAREGQWACAHDVFCSIREHAQAGGDPWLTMWSAKRAGPLARHLGDRNASDMTYMIAAQIAQQLNHVECRLRVSLGMAENVLTYHDDLSRAIALVRSVAVEARLHGSSNLASETLHHLAYLFNLKRDYVTSVRLTTAALRSTDDQDAIERIKANLAASLACLGHTEAARELNLSVLRQTREEDTRQAALINLLELSAIDNNRLLFERYRQKLAEAPLPARIRATFHLFSGQGLHAFGQTTAAQEELRHALAITTEHHLAHVLPTVQANLQNIGRPVSTVV